MSHLEKATLVNIIELFQLYFSLTDCNNNCFMSNFQPIKISCSINDLGVKSLTKSTDKRLI